ncbi:hypothetical protein [Roseibium sp.]|uniref:hypothetical protein n=1 Tax=Roseibium sp. TaxID=1936156 RepID=UPI003A983868
MNGLRKLPETRLLSVLLSLCLLALLTVHSVGSARAVGGSEGEFSDFVLPDGSLPSLCINSGTTDGEAERPTCPACVLAKALADVPPTSFDFRQDGYLAAMQRPDGDQVQLLAVRTQYRPRAPPHGFGV